MFIEFYKFVFIKTKSNQPKITISMFKNRFSSLIKIFIVALLLFSLTSSIRISNDWVRFLKVVNTNDPNMYAKAVFRFSDNVMVYFGCNVYECSYFKSGYEFYLQNQGLCQQRTQLYCEDPTIDKKYLDLMRQASEVRE